MSVGLYITDDVWGGCGVLTDFSVCKALKCPILVQCVSSSGCSVPACAFFKDFLFSKIFLVLHLQECARLYTVNFCKINI